MGNIYIYTHMAIYIYTHIYIYTYIYIYIIRTDILMRKILRKGWSFVLMERLETHLCN